MLAIRKLAYAVAYSLPLAALCFVLYNSTLFYSAYYPYSTIIGLPRGSATIFIGSIFNGYSEQVQSAPAGESPYSIKNAAFFYTDATIKDLALAYFAILLSMALYVASNPHDTRSSAFKSVRFLPLTFLLALLISQYLIVLLFLVFNIAVSGISLFTVDSFVVLIAFVAYDMLLITRLMQRARAAQGPSSFRTIKKYWLPIRALQVLLPFMLVYPIFNLILYLGAIGYRGSFLGTYAVHLLGIFAFSIIFFPRSKIDLKGILEDGTASSASGEIRNPY